MFNVVVTRLTELLLLKAGPQDLPTSQGLLQFAAALFFASAMARLLLVGSYAAATAQAVIHLVLLALFVRRLLAWRQTPERFVQTMTALLLAGGAIGLLLLFPLQSLQPLLQAMTENPDISPQQLQIPAMAMYAWAGLSVWGLVVSAHIFRHALGMTLGMGVCVALLYELLLIVVIGVLTSLT